MGSVQQLVATDTASVSASRRHHAAKPPQCLLPLAPHCTYVGHIVHGAGDEDLRAMPPLRGQGGRHPKQQLGGRPDLQVTAAA